MFQLPVPALVFGDSNNEVLFACLSSCDAECNIVCNQLPCPVVARCRGGTITQPFSYSCLVQKHNCEENDDCVIIKPCRRS